MYLGKNEIRSLHEKGIFGKRKINKSRFNRDWTLFRFKSLKLFIFDIMNNKKDKRVYNRKAKNYIFVTKEKIAILKIVSFINTKCFHYNNN